MIRNTSWSVVGNINIWMWRTFSRRYKPCITVFRHAACSIYLRCILWGSQGAERPFAYGEGRGKKIVLGRQKSLLPPPLFRNPGTVCIIRQITKKNSISIQNRIFTIYFVHRMHTNHCIVYRIMAIVVSL